MAGDDVVAPLLKKSTDLQPDIQIKAPKWKFVIEPYLFLSSLIFMPVYVCHSQYIYKRIAESYNASEDISLNHNGSSACGLNKSEPEYVLREEIQSAASYLTMELTVVYSCSAIVSTMWLGSMSDKKGRKYPLVFTSVGGMLSTLVYAVVCYLDLDIHYFFIGEFVGGVTGGWESLLVACFAYIADTTTKAERAFRIILLEMSFFVNASYMSVVTGYLIQYLGFFWIYCITVCGKILCLLYILFLVPETIVPLKRVTLCTLEHFQYSFRIFKTNMQDRTRTWKLIILYFAFFFINMVSLNSNVDTLFQMNAPLCWDSVLIGYYNCAYIGVGTVFGTVAAKIMTKYIPDAIIAVIGAVAQTGQYLYKAFCVTTVMMFIVPVFSIFGILLIPIMRTLVSKAVGPNEQGAALSFLAIMQLLCSCFGNILFHTIYSETLYIMSGFVYITTGITMFLVTLVLCFYVGKYKGWKRESRQEIAAPEVEPVN